MASREFELAPADKGAVAAPVSRTRLGANHTALKETIPQRISSPAQLMTARQTSPSVSAQVHRSMMQLQRDYGNQHVQRMIFLARQEAAPAEAGADVEQAIQGKRGGGMGLDSPVRGQMEKAFGADFSGVRVHHDHAANSLNHALQARAFTTGQDIFFRQGAYQPGTSGGRELIAHELTHVVQQNGERVEKKVQAKMTVSQPGDIYEVEADRMATAVIRQESQPAITGDAQHGVHRQPEHHKEEEEKKLHRSADPGINRQAERGFPDE